MARMPFSNSTESNSAVAYTMCSLEEKLVHSRHNPSGPMETPTGSHKRLAGWDRDAGDHQCLSSGGIVHAQVVVEGLEAAS